MCDANGGVAEWRSDGATLRLVPRPMVVRGHEQRYERAVILTLNYYAAAFSAF